MFADCASGIRWMRVRLERKLNNLMTSFISGVFLRRTLGFPSALIICRLSLFTIVYAAQCLTQTLPSCIHKSLLVHCTTCHGRLSHHLVNGKLFQKEDMFAHKHRPRAPVFTVVMAALSYSTNRPSMFRTVFAAQNVCLCGQRYNFVALNFCLFFIFFFFVPKVNVAKVGSEAKVWPKRRK